MTQDTNHASLKIQLPAELDSGSIKKQYFLEADSNLVFETPTRASFFFGYYDKCPTDKSAQRLLAHCANFDGRNINENDAVEIGYFDIPTGRWHAVTRSRAFNWQQGAMLQWLGPDYSTKIIFNDRSDDSFISVIINLETGSTRKIPHPVYAVHPGGKIAIGVNFERHFFCRAYHYEGIHHEKWRCPIHPEDGLYQIDLVNGTSNLIIRTKDLACTNPIPTMENANHWLEHVMWNPSGTRFAFLHRFGHGEDFKTRLFTANPEGKDIYLFPDFDIISHMGWRNDSEFVVWAKPNEYLTTTYAKILKQDSLFSHLLFSAYRFAKKHVLSSKVSQGLRRGGACYMLMQDRSQLWTPVGFNVLKADGHPSWTKDGRFMLTDTYADESNFRHVLLYDEAQTCIHLLGKFFSPHNNTGYRCDLHPRFSHEENSVIVDSAHSGRRQIIIFNLDKHKIGSI
jgi:hypothetical protein